MIAEGRIALNGEKLTTPATLLESLAGVSVDGKPVQPAAATQLFRFHKPQGTITAARDPKGRATIYDRLPPGLPRLMPVGRLDTCGTIERPRAAWSSAASSASRYALGAKGVCASV